MLIPTQLYVEPNQEKRIMKAYQKRRGCRIKVRKGAAATSHHRGEMLLTPQQWTKYQATTRGKSFNIPFKHEELAANMKHKGGFLPLIAAALAPIIGGVAGGLIEREIAGSGIYKKKKKTSSKKRKSKGSGMYLNPYTKKSGRGMYLNPYIKR